MELDANVAKKLSPFCVKLFEAKQRTNLTFVEIGRRMQRNEVWVAAVFYGQAKPSNADLKRLLNIFNAEGELSLLDYSQTGLEEYFPDRGQLAEVPLDPVLSRLHEVLNVYGHPIKAIIKEKFGDGIMSAVDCKINVDKEHADAGDRVKIVIDGKFLTYSPW